MAQDHDLQQAVLAELAWEPSVTAAHLGVSAKSGVATLTGHVEAFAQKTAAEQAALRIRGVKAVAEIEVRLPFDRKRGDDDIAAAAIEWLAWSADVPADRFTVKVEKGWVTLSGMVGLSNQITVKPRVDTSGLSDDINHAPHRSWFSDASNLHVSAQGGQVHLTGTVGSQHDRQSAASTAWAAPGATDVINDITVS